MAAADVNDAPQGNILVGTASWSDPGFVERWYPKGLAAGNRLPWYAQHFEMVEVNSTFYAVPDLRMVERWIHATPDEFTFDLKLHQLLSRHSTAAKLLPPALQRRAEVDAKGKVILTPELEEAVAREILKAAELLRGAGKMGALLLQLSPAFSPRKHRLEELAPLLELLSPQQVAVEFRNRNWAEGERLQELLEFLRAHSAALVSVDTPAEEHFTIMPPELDEITNPQLAYLRLHGRDAHAYTTGKTVATRFDYDYNDEEISEVAKRAKKLSKEAPQVHIVFNNNTHDYAPHAALRLRKALGQIAKAPPRQSELF
ncbi:MAG: DUF72 domain-containing protein [Verrucomicrobiota bacterium]|nr:DUF72 domain-containing protein [Verrucomicrobiota bacterium]